MTPSLLREYVTLVLEKIRTKKGQKGLMGNKFEISKFKSLDNYHAALAYAQKFLQLMGQGSSRAAFLLSGKYVVKVALNDKGVDQNRAEVSVYTNPASQPVVAKVFQAHPKYLWVISEVVRPLQNTQEFETLTGVDWETFSEYVNDGISNKKLDPGAPKFIRSIIKTALSNELLRGDLAQQDFSHSAQEDVLSHYGKTGDGRLVLLDYGFTHEVWSTHYKKQQDALRGKTSASQDRTQNNVSKDTDVDATAKTEPAHGASKAKGSAKTKKDAPSPARPQTDPNAVKTAAPARKKAAGAEDDDAEKTRR